MNDFTGAASATPPETWLGAGAGAEAPAADGSVSDGAGLADVLAALAGLQFQTAQFQERSRASEELIRQLQARVEELQGDQVRALLKPMIQRIAALHAQTTEARERAAERGDAAEKDFAFFLQGVEDALSLLDVESVGAAPGLSFDASKHHAVQAVPTEDPTQDRTILRVLRQGFTYAGAARVLLPAHVVVHRLEPDAAIGATASTTPHREQEGLRR